jgi:hypothetical protein
MQLNRKEVVQQLIDHKGFENYLEIGVFLGHVFFDINAKHKVAVDPNVKYSRFKLLKRSFKYNNSNLRATSIKLTSDDFFAREAPKIYRNREIDICLVDGMHEYGFALRDVENTLRYLQKGGVIVMHDCNPQTKASNASYEEWERSGFAGMWNGDVWKTIVHLRSLRNDINVFVLDTDQGLGIVTFGNPESKLNFSAEQIKALSYEELEQNRREWLNLKGPDYFFEYFGIKKP